MTFRNRFERVRVSVSYNVQKGRQSIRYNDKQIGTIYFSMNDQRNRYFGSPLPFHPNHHRTRSANVLYDVDRNTRCCWKAIRVFRSSWTLENLSTGVHLKFDVARQRYTYRDKNARHLREKYDKKKKAKEKNTRLPTLYVKKKKNNRFIVIIISRISVRIRPFRWFVLNLRDPL